MPPSQQRKEVEEALGTYLKEVVVGDGGMHMKGRCAALAGGCRRGARERRREQQRVGRIVEEAEAGPIALLLPRVGRSQVFSVAHDAELGGWRDPVGLAVASLLPLAGRPPGTRSSSLLPRRNLIPESV